MTRLTRRGLIVGGAALGLPVVGLALCKVWCRVRGRAGPIYSSCLLCFQPPPPPEPWVRDTLLQTRSSAFACFRRIEQDDRISKRSEKGLPHYNACSSGAGVSRRFPVRAHPPHRWLGAGPDRARYRGSFHHVAGRRRDRRRCNPIGNMVLPDRMSIARADQRFSVLNCRRVVDHRRHAGAISEVKPAPVSPPPWVPLWGPCPTRADAVFAAQVPAQIETLGAAEGILVPQELMSPRRVRVRSCRQYCRTQTRSGAFSRSRRAGRSSIL